MQRAAADAEPARSAVRVQVLQVVLLRPALLAVAQPQGRERRLAGSEQRQDRLVQHLLDRPAQQLGHLRVDVQRPPGGVGHPDALQGGLGDRAVALLRGPQGLHRLDLTGDVAQVEHEAADVRVAQLVAQGHLDPAPPAVGVPVPVGERGGRQVHARDAGEGRPHLRLVVRVDVVPAAAAEHVRRGEAEDLLAGGAAPQDAAVRTVHDGDVGRALHQRPEEHLLLGQAAPRLGQAGPVGAARRQAPGAGGPRAGRTGGDERAGAGDECGARVGPVLDGRSARHAEHPLHLSVGTDEAAAGHPDGRPAAGPVDDGPGPLVVARRDHVAHPGAGRLDRLLRQEQLPDGPAGRLVAGPPEQPLRGAVPVLHPTADVHGDDRLLQRVEQAVHHGGTGGDASQREEVADVLRAGQQSSCLSWAARSWPGTHRARPGQSCSTVRAGPLEGTS